MKIETLLIHPLPIYPACKFYQEDIFLKLSLYRLLGIVSSTEITQLLRMKIGYRNKQHGFSLEYLSKDSKLHQI